MRVLVDTCRALYRSPRFTAAAVLILTIGIGLNVATLGFVQAILLQPLPYKDADQLVRIWEANPSRVVARSQVSRGNFADWRRDARSFSSIEAFSPASENVVSIEGEPEVLQLAMVTAGFTSMLGVSPIVKREEGKGYLLSYRYWQRRFGGDARVVAQVVRQDTAAIPVLGVMPRGYDFPTGADAWGVMSFGTQRGARNLNVVARLKPGISLEQGRAELQTIAADLSRRYPTENDGWVPVMERLQDTLVEPIRPTLWLLYAAVTLLTALTIVTVAVLYAVQGTARARDFAIRLSLGATRAHLVSRVVLESCIICTCAGAGAGLLAWATIRFVAAEAPATIPRMVELQAGRGSLVTLATLSTIAAVAMATAGALNAGGRASLRARATAGNARLRPGLIVTEIAACVCLLAIASHAIVEFNVLQRTDLGLEPGHVMTAQIELPVIKAGERVKHYPTRRFARTALDVIAAARELPAVTAAAVSMRTPFGRPSRATTYRVLGAARTGPITGMPPVSGPDTRPALLRIVSAGYFETMGTPVRTGRSFTDDDRLDDRQIDDFDADRDAGAAIVSDAFARREWPGRSAVGRYLEVDDASYRSVRIVGVVADVPEVPGSPAGPVIYLPFAQEPLADFTLLIRTTGPAEALAGPLRLRLRQVNDLSAFNLRTLDDVLDSALASPRFASRVLSAFGAIAVSLMAIALYAVLALSVALRQRDLAIRLAVGAAPQRLLRLVVGQGTSIGAVGVALGLLGAVAASRAMRSAIPGISEVSFTTATAVSVVVFAATLLASYIPARRAARVDPLQILRAD